MKKATVRDVASKAQVSTATVSRVVHGQRVRPGVKERVEAAMAALQYRPNLAARNLRTNASGIIACVIRGLLMPELSPFIRAAESELRAAGYTLLLASSNEEAETQKELIERIMRQGVDGLLFTATSDEGNILKNTMENIGLPTVLLDREADFLADSSVVDHQNGIRLAVDYLASLGHRRICLLTVPQSMRPGRERVLAFNHALAANGIAADEAIIQDHFLDGAQAALGVAQLLESANPPTAIISGGMTLLSSVLRATNMLGRKIPQDLSIVAGCDSELAEIFTPSITTIRWDVWQWGTISARLLLERIGAKAPLEKRQWIMPTELVVRNSCMRIHR